MRGSWLGATVLSVLLVQNGSATEAASLPVGNGEFNFIDWSGPSINVRTYVPESVTDTTPIVIVMHGNTRDVDRYFDDWSAQGKLNGFVIVVPEFNVDDFEGSARYHLGNVFNAKKGFRRPENKWTFSAIEPLFDQVVASLGGKQASYTLYGHSAGAQFVHRFLYYKPDARVKRAIAANAGWYTLPVYGVSFPYGLDGSGLREKILPAVFARDVVLLLGDADVDPDDESLRQTEEAQRQGPHRYARGVMMYRVAKAKAAKLGVDFNWKLVEVHGAQHSNAQMAPAAAGLVE